MEIGSEISHKIRSAIKAKLVELGAYVDDELPDYIMVMVANKKTLLQMTEDLNLFLGLNTEKFTTWLHNLITKLQSISSEAVPEEKTVEKKENVEEKKEKKKISEKKKKVNNNAPSEQTTASTEKTNNIAAKEQSVNKASKPTETPVEKKDSAVQEAEEPEFTVRADTDEFSEELKEIEKQETEAKKTNQKLDVSVPTPSQTSSSVSSSVPKSQPVPVSSTPAPPTVSAPHDRPVPTSNILSRLSDKKTVVRIENVTDGRSVVHTETKPTVIRRTGVLRSAELTTNRRRGPSSVVTSIPRHHDEEEEEYDPHNPSVGNVASVVRVTARKSSVPRSLQANKSLLMKAMTDAEKSVLSKRSASTRQERVPMTSMYADGRGTITIDNSNVGRLYNPLKPGLTSRSKKEEMMRKIKYTIVNEPSGNSFEETASDEDTEPDNRVVEVDKEEETESSEAEVSTSDTHIVLDRGLVQQDSGGDTEEGEEVPVILDEEEEASEFQHFLEKEEEEAAHVRQQLLMQRKRKPDMDQEGREEDDSTRVVKENPKNTKFIVTLDGIDPDQYSESMDTDVLDTKSEKETETELIAKITPPKIKPFSINLKDSDDEEDSSVTPLKKAKMTEKCRFWPACINGNSCDYHHPTIPCKTFPNCKFGDKCLYIHPNCKYDARCTKADCPFTHASRRKPVSISPPQVIAIPQPKVILAAPPVTTPPTHPRQVTCKYFPKCHNMRCPFKHPKPCRYGMSCAKKSGCPFFHPALPSKDKLKWKSEKVNQSPTSPDGIKAS